MERAIGLIIHYIQCNLMINLNPTRQVFNVKSNPFPLLVSDFQKEIDPQPYVRVNFRHNDINRTRIVICQRAFPSPVCVDNESSLRIIEFAPAREHRVKVG